MGIKRKKNEKLENKEKTPRLWHGEIPIEITGLNEEEIKKLENEWRKNKTIS